MNIAFSAFVTHAAAATGGPASGNEPSVATQCVPALCRILLRGPEGSLALVTALEEAVAAHVLSRSCPTEPGQIMTPGTTATLAHAGACAHGSVHVGRRTYCFAACDPG